MVARLTDLDAAYSDGKLQRELHVEKVCEVYYDHTVDPVFPVKEAYDRRKRKINEIRHDLQPVINAEPGDPDEEEVTTEKKDEVTNVASDEVADAEETTQGLEEGEGDGGSATPKPTTSSEQGGIIKESDEAIPARYARSPLPDLTPVVH